MIAQMPQELRQ